MYLFRFLKKSQLLLSSKLLLLILIAFVSIIASCSKNDYSSNSMSNNTPETNDIFIQGMAFSPANKTISVGTAIKWTNHDGFNHTVTSGVPGTPSGLFDSGNIGSNGTFSYTFTQAGTFNFFCKIHNSMRGTITVQ